VAGTPPEQPPTVTLRIRRTHLWGVGGAVLGVVLGLVVGRATVDDPRPVIYGLPPAADASQNAAVKVNTAGRPALGPARAKVTMVEFVDFECPFCGRYARETFPRLQRDYGARVRYVSRQFPLDIHPHAQDAAVAAECAAEQGRYWQYHRQLFAHQQSLDRRGLVALARRAGLDTRRHSACIRSGPPKARVARDVAEGRSYGVTGTPTFFINGRLVRGAQPYGQLKSQLDAALR
jgi:protein-disulfide isomerase